MPRAPYQQVLFTAAEWQQLGIPGSYDLTPHTLVIAFIDADAQVVSASFAEDDMPAIDRANPAYPLLDSQGQQIAPARTP